MYRNVEKLFDSIKILFLAKYAPIEEDTKPELHPADGIVPIYHYEMYSILKKMFRTIHTSNDLSILFSNNIKADYIFALYNRAPFRNSEIFVSAICEYKRLPYLGAPSNIRATAEDKHLTKLLASYLKIPTAPWEVYGDMDIGRFEQPSFGGPYFIKPRFGAASEHISELSIAPNWREAETVVADFVNQGIEIIVEKYIDGLNVTVPILSNGKTPVFPCVMATSKKSGNILTYRLKRKLEEGLHREILEEDEATRLMRNYALKLYKKLRPLDYARFDFVVERESKVPFFLETNVCSNLGSHSSIMFSAKSIGLTQEELIRLILLHSFKRQKLLRQ